jgi:hypothetical protein
MAVNDQLRYLKAGELVFRAGLPRVHGFVRGVYDFVGPLVARCFFCSVVADVVYVSLKPAEWFCRLGLRVVLGRRFRETVGIVL